MQVRRYVTNFNVDKVYRLFVFKANMGKSLRTLSSSKFVIQKVFCMSSLHLSLPNKMELLKERIVRCRKWLKLCYRPKMFLCISGQKLWIEHVAYIIKSLCDLVPQRQTMSYREVKSQTFDIFISLQVLVTFLPIGSIGRIGIPSQMKEFFWDILQTPKLTKFLISVLALLWSQSMWL